MKKKYIIGIGCSWTQGEGGYPDEIWHQYNGSPQRQLRGKDDHCLRKIEHENSWVNVLCRDHFPEYESINLGVKGSGNTAAAHQLHFCDKVDFDNSEGIIVMMLSGFERLDVFQQDPFHPAWNSDDYYSKNEFAHYKWRTGWPIPSQKDGDPFFDFYGRELWSEKFVASTQLMAILDAQTFAKACGYKFVLANAFNHKSSVKEYFREYCGSMTDKIDWTNYIHDTVDYTAFMQLLVEKDGLMPREDWGGYYNFYKQRDWPSKYLTNCDGAHPTIDGYKVIASELSDFIKKRGYV
jgi:hypothetical protein